MATRFWLTSSAPPYTPATRRGSWTTASGEDVQLLGRKPAGSAGTSSIALAAGSGTRKVLLHRSISAGAVAAGTLSGTVQWMIGVKESNALLDAVWHLHVYVTSGDTDTPRGTLLSNYTGATEFGLTAAGAGEGSQAVSAVAVQVGDRIVVEIGYETSTTTAASYNATINYGGSNASATDLGSADTAVTVNPGWVEFSGGDGLFTPSFNTLADAFTSSIDAKWAKTANVTSTGGRARIPCTTTLEDMYTASVYAIQGGAIAFQVPTVPAAGGGSSVAFSAYLSAGPTISTTNLEFEYSPGTGNLVLRNSVGGTDASPTTLAYDPTAHAWWRFRESGGSITMDTSPDGATWTTRRTISPSQWMRTGNLIFYVEAQRGSGTADFAEIDNINQGSTVVVAAGTAVDTSTARPAVGLRTGTAGRGQETSQARPAATLRLAQAGRGTDASTARPAQGQRAAAAGRAADTSAAQPLAAARIAAAGRATEVNAARPAVGIRTGRIGIAVEQDLAIATVTPAGPPLGTIRVGPLAGSRWTVRAPAPRWRAG